MCFKIRWISKLWVLSDAFWIRLRFLRHSLWNKDLLDTHLDLLDTDITSKIFACLQDIFKVYLQDAFKTYLQGMSSRRLKDVFSVTIFRLPRRLPDVLREVLKTSSRRLKDVFARRPGRHKIVTLKTCWRRL